MVGDRNFGDRPGFPNETAFDLATFKRQVAALDDDDATLADVLKLLGMDDTCGDRSMNDGAQPPQRPQK